MKILILKPTSLGDVVQAIPVLRLLKRHFPQSQIYWWIARELAPLLEEDPDLAGLIIFDRRRWIHPQFWPEMAQSIRSMREARFDWVIDLQSLARSAIFSWLANGQFSIGLADSREAAAAFYDVAVARPRHQRHAIDWYLRVLTTLGVPVHWNFEWLPPRPDALAALRKKWPTAGCSWIALHPSARWITKRWPMAHYMDLVKQLSLTHRDSRFVILGNGRDENSGLRLADAAPDRCLDLTGQTSLPELVEWLRLSRILITNDTGPMHIAAALRKPVVAVFGPTDPERTGPYDQIKRVLRLDLPCQPCMRPTCHYTPVFACLRDLLPARVGEEINRRLQEA